VIRSIIDQVKIGSIGFNHSRARVTKDPLAVALGMPDDRACGDSRLRQRASRSTPLVGGAKAGVREVALPSFEQPLVSQICEPNTAVSHAFFFFQCVCTAFLLGIAKSEVRDDH
jgi:hypothetical protein